MTKLMGLNILVTIYRRTQQTDDAIGGSVQGRETVATNCPARIGSPKTPQMLRAQGIEQTNLYDCNIQSPNYVPLDVRIEDIVVPQTGQYAGKEFAVMSVQDDSTQDALMDLRRHKSLSVRRIEYARTEQ